MTTYWDSITDFIDINYNGKDTDDDSARLIAELNKIGLEQTWIYVFKDFSNYANKIKYAAHKIDVTAGASDAELVIIEYLLADVPDIDEVKLIEPENLEDYNKLVVSALKNTTEYKRSVDAVFDFIDAVEDYDRREAERKDYEASIDAEWKRSR